MDAPPTPTTPSGAGLESGPWVDTHCHLDASEFEADRHSVRIQARERGVVRLVLPAVQRTHWQGVRRLAQHYGDSYALGIHPLYTQYAQDSDIEQLAHALQAQRNDPHLVAVGEIGLDFFAPGVDSARQIFFFRAQLQLARRFDLPVLLHTRRSVDSVLKGLREIAVPGGIAHAFNGSAQQAQTFLALGYKLGFGGAATFERARHLRHLLATLPESAIVLETDAPDMPPQWCYRSSAQRQAGQAQGRNSPAELPRIAQELAAVRGVSVSAWAKITSDNADAALPRLTQKTTIGAAAPSFLKTPLT